ncbi:carbonic anhydrase [Uliginosibacterium aquaticum]|nr:carbonic anhydrase family protein [Uliginosibacterium aquaticum]
MMKKAWIKSASALAMLLSAPLCMAAEAVHWAYDGEAAPAHWGELAPEFAACGAGKNQSPVNVSGELKAALPKLRFSYTTAVTEVLNNGHTIQANFAPGSTLRLGDHSFELKQVHFHAPSENTIHGKQFPLEGHLVHQDQDGRLAVVAVMFKPGKAQSGLARIWQQMPEAANTKQAFDGKLLAGELLPRKRDYYYFSGSLTTPPCSEGVSWIVLKQAVESSDEQVSHFSHVMHHPNNRPVQPLNSRIVIN